MIKEGTDQLPGPLMTGDWSALGSGPGTNRSPP